MSRHLRSKRHVALIAMLAATRRAAGLSQRELARRLGRPHSYIGKLESGERQLSVLELCELADALKIDPAMLISKICRKS